ncbi:hypothetical protein DXV76_08185 [Rhodobacteraceae bacterium CCMM004]|nr:hypothetical protein DXV76_08185 [Rhodobacteraceae bacterium CCMM004]
MTLTCAALPGAVGQRWNQIPTTCHMATCYRLYEAEFGTPLTTMNAYLDAFPNPTGVIASMIPHGQRLTRPGHGAAQLRPHSVLIFVRNEQALHSCIAINATTIGGYNQTGWFTSAGVDHGYSTHQTADIDWTGPHSVDGNGYAAELYQVDEMVARAAARASGQRVPT